MASKGILHQYLETYESEHREDCFMNTELICPVKIEFCDASAYGRTFSDSVVDFSLYPGLLLLFFQFRGNGPQALDSYLKGEANRTEEISRLEEFVKENGCYACDNVDQVKKNTINDHAVSQVLAQTITKAFTEVKKNGMLSGLFIPSFIATSRVVRITMYNCELDSLVMTKDLRIFRYDIEEGKFTLDVSTILSIWYALNFQNSNSPFPEFERIHVKSNFKEQAGTKLAIYNEKCTKPMTEAEDYQADRFKISGSCFSSPLSCEIQKTLSSYH